MIKEEGGEKEAGLGRQHQYDKSFCAYYILLNA